MDYDVVIIGAGTAGIFAGYELSRLNPGLRILILEQGMGIDKRSCPIVAKKVKSCVGCKPCSIMSGFGGAGAYSDGKYNFTTAFGGWLTEYLSEDEVMELLYYVDGVNVKFGATDVIFSTETEESRILQRRALEHDLHLLQAKVKHLGTENNLQILKNIYYDMKERVEFRFGAHVSSFEKVDGGFRICSGDGEFNCKYLIAGPGRSGAEWFSDRCRKLGLQQINNQVDVGVRVELPALVMKHIWILR